MMEENAPTRPSGCSSGSSSGWPSARRSDRPSGPLWDKARALRERHWGRDVHLRGIVEFSSHCRRNCLYCGLRRDNTDLVRYRMDAGAVMECARAVKRLGFGTVVLQSGEDPAWTGPDLAALVARVKGELGLAVTLSVGERAPGEYRLWRTAGADRYLLKMETMDPELHARLRPDSRFQDRLRCLESLFELGYETGTGLIAGLPGERADGIERGIQALAALKPDMFSISPFTPHPATPLGAHPAFGVTETLRGMALARIAMPTAHIPVTSALGLHGDAARLAGLEVGNVLMPSLTPEPVRESYAIYPGKNRQGTGPEERARAMRELLPQAGFTLPPGPGKAWRLGRGSAPGPRQGSAPGPRQGSALDPAGG